MELALGDVVKFKTDESEDNYGSIEECTITRQGKVYSVMSSLSSIHGEIKEDDIIATYELKKRKVKRNPRKKIPKTQEVVGQVVDPIN